MDIPETVSLLNQERENNQLYVSLVEARPTYYSDDKTLPALPASVLNVLQTERTASRALVGTPESARAAARDSVRPGGQRQLFAANHGKVESKLMNIFRVLCARFCAWPRSAYAVDTKTWEQAEMADFEKGQPHAALAFERWPADAGAGRERDFRSVGHVPVGGRARFQGNLYAGGGGLGGSKAKLFRSRRARARPRRWRNSTAWRFRRSPSTGRIACTRPLRPTAKCIASTPRASRKCSTIRKTKYIWALAFSKSGDLFVATGDQGEIHRVTPAGVGLGVLQDRRNACAVAGDGRE